ncbi:MAG: 50S ribosomal protein L22 [Nanoarchaeota archaeon]|nr:50S ribosomal protein L22 [Nanoarchaeota archaeon]MBU1632772.1 50S ribosomal protein L22 [Nanoarchaeota archaeon]MBU1876388.1 50S ribosomal protein L22 [Nanoarchaeota archaeon]
MASKNKKSKRDNVGVAKAFNLPVSTKQCIEICSSLRYKNTTYAKKFLEDVIALRKPVPFKKFYRDVGHKKGNISAGRFPQKAAKEILSLVKSVEANAQVKGLATSNLKITKIFANQASIPLTGGRNRSGTKRTHVEIEVKELGSLKEDKKIAGKKEIKEIKEVKETIDLPKESKPSTTIANKKEPKVNDEETKTKVVEKKPIKEEVKEEPKIEESVSEQVVEKVKSEVKEKKPEEKKEKVVEKKVVKEEAPVKELSPAELLKKAQENAAVLNKKEKEKESTDKVAQLYKELQQKGSLRSKGGQQ